MCRWDEICHLWGERRCGGCGEHKYHITTKDILMEHDLQYDTMIIFDYPLEFYQKDGSKDEIFGLLLYSKICDKTQFYEWVSEYITYMVAYYRGRMNGCKVIDKNTWISPTGYIVNLHDVKVQNFIQQYLKDSLEYRIINLDNSILVNQGETVGNFITRRSLIQRYTHRS